VRNNVATEANCSWFKCFIKIPQRIFAIDALTCSIRKPWDGQLNSETAYMKAIGPISCRF